MNSKQHCSIAPALAAWAGALAMGFAPVASAAGATLTLAETRPLSAGEAAAPAPWPTGTRWKLDARGLSGPEPLQCQPARQHLLRVPAQGLFQGAWQPGDPASGPTLPAALGLTGTETATLRLDCVNASFDFHRGAPNRWLTALDGRVLVLRRRLTDGDAQTPVRELLLQHLSELGTPFDAVRVSRLRAWLTPALSAAFRRWLARPAQPERAPQLDGDPFTGTQEPPCVLTLGLLEQAGPRAAQVVEVDTGAGSPLRLTFRLQRGRAGKWRIADIDYGEGGTLLELMRMDIEAQAGGCSR